MRSLSDVDRDLAVEHDRITNAYWTYTRTARGKPPVMVVPDAYRRRRELTEERRRILRMSTPNLITESGREGLTLDDRRAMLHAEAACFEADAFMFEQSASAAAIRTRRGLISRMRAAAESSRPGSYAALAEAECLVLAWRRGELREYERVIAAQRAG